MSKTIHVNSADELLLTECFAPGFTKLRCTFSKFAKTALASLIFAMQYDTAMANNTVDMGADGSTPTLVVSRAVLSAKADKRNVWRDMMLELALEKTRASHGPYEIREVPQMSRARLWKSMSSNRYPNMFFAVAYRGGNRVKYPNLAFIPFPVQLGFLGYRVCFYPRQESERIQSAISDGELQSLSYGLGRDWEDNDIMRHNGFTVDTVSDYESMFRMTAAGRFDMFCRGVSEVYDEYQRHKDIENLVLDEKLAFHYHLPVFFYTNVANVEARDRVFAGLKAAHEDGSLADMFTSHYQEKIEFTRLKSRTIVRLESPLIVDLDPGYQQYYFQP